MDKKLLKEVYSGILSVSSIPVEIKPVDVEKAQRIVRHIAFSTPLLSIVRGVCSRIIKVKGKDPADEKCQEIQSRLYNIENFRGLIKNLAETPYFGFSTYEIIYNDDFSIKRLELIPYRYSIWDKDDQVWKLSGNTDYEMDEEKFLIAVYNKTLEHQKGDGLFNYGIGQVYEDFVELEAKIRGLQQKYGAVIPVFAYDVDDIEKYNSDGTINQDPLKKVRDRAENLKGATDANAIAIPVTDGGDLKNSFTYISLSDLKIEMQLQMIKQYDERIEKFIKGATFSEGSSSGSYSKDKVQQTEKEKIEDDICTFVSEQLHKLIAKDAFAFGYDANDYQFIFELDEGETALAELEKIKAEVTKEKLTGITELTKLGYTVDKITLAKILGIDPAQIIEKEYEIQQPSAEFAEGKKKKKVDLYYNKTLYNLKKLERWQKESAVGVANNIRQQVKDAILKVKTIDDLDMSLDYSYLQNQITISALIGAWDEKELNLVEFAEEVLQDNPFEMSYDEAVKYLLEKTPALYEEITPISNLIARNFFWVKASTDLSLTEKLQNSLIDSIRDGHSLNEWREEADYILENIGIGDNPWYTELVYRNNVHSAYNTGAFHMQEANKENKPYGLYDAIEDSRITDLCQSLDGKVYALDHEFWDTFMPPNHHNCRSRRIALDKDDMDEYNLKEEKKLPYNFEELYDQAGTFAGSPTSGLKKSVASKQSRVNKNKETLHVVLNSPNFEKVTWDRIEPKFAQKIQKQLNKLSNKYKNSSNILTMIDDSKNGGSVIGQHSGGFRFENGQLIWKHDLKFNPHFLINEARAKITMENMSKNVFGVNKTTNTLYAVTHEYGHLLDRAYAIKKGNYIQQIKDLESVINPSWIDIDSAKLLNEQIRHSAYSLTQQVREKMLVKFDLDTNVKFKAFCEKEFGTYSTKSDLEFFAEAFAQYNHVPKSKQSKALKQFGIYFEELYKEVF